MLWWRTREGIHGAWILAFAFIFLDDALAVHERIGRLIANQGDYGTAFWLRAQDPGELTVSALAGVIFLALLVFFYFRGGEDARRISRDVALMLAAFVFFGVVVDVLHIAIKALTVVEEGGEMVTLSLITAYVAQLTREKKSGPAISPTLQPPRTPRRGRASAVTLSPSLPAPTHNP